MMPTYTVEVEFLVPHYIQLQVEAENPIAAYEQGAKMEREDFQFEIERDCATASANYVMSVWEGKSTEGQNVTPDAAKQHRDNILDEYMKLKLENATAT